MKNRAVNMSLNAAAVIALTAGATLAQDQGQARPDPRGNMQGMPYRTIDGSNNNPFNPDWGALHADILHLGSAPAFTDGTDAMPVRANARVISNVISQQVAPLGNDAGLTSMFWQWGQFIDHDFALIHTDVTEFMPVFVPGNDNFFTPGTMLPFTRSQFERDESGVRKFTSGITHFIDGSNLYGSDQELADHLREFSGGRLRESDPGFLPFNTEGFPNANDAGFFPDEEMYLAGDFRANEQAGLLAMHNLWLREHNYWADRLAAARPNWSDERLYQTARRIVGAEMQKITYEDWLPLLIGENALPPYTGFKPSTNPNISSVFSGAAFRIGHTQLNDQLLRLNQDGSPFPGGHLELRDAFFFPALIRIDGSFDAILRGLAWQEANEVDTQAIDSVRSFLFGFPGAGGMDLITLNVMRGRDFGLPDYNTIREDLGLPRITSFSELSPDPALNAKFAAMYPDVDSIDPWPGMMAEAHVPGTASGETARAVFVDQFTRLRDGDRFFYRGDNALRPFLAEIRQTTLADIIVRNTDISSLQTDVFRMPDASPEGCNEADIAEPFGTLDVFDIIAYIRAFAQRDEAADIVAPDGVVNILDLIAYLQAFSAGCDS